MDATLTAVELPLDDVPFPDLAQAHELWLRLRGQRWAPARADLDPVDIPRHILPRIIMVDVSDDPLDFRYRHWGTGVTALHGEDMTGRRVGALRPPVFAELVWRQYAEVVERKAAGLYVHEVPTKYRHWRRHAILRLPFSSDGERVDIVMSVDDYSDGVEQLRPYYQGGVSEDG